MNINMDQTSKFAKASGAFYTPKNVADVLANWVVQTGKERLLEPSSGDGALVRAAIERAQLNAGDKHGLSFIVCDIDQEATNQIRHSLSSEDNVLEGDFLRIHKDALPAVDGIIANPPFTRNHSINPEYRKEMRQRFKIDGAAGLWVYFLFHAFSFLKPGGRLASLIPASALFTQYGKKALKRICQQFAHVEIRRILEQPRWVGRADERGAMIFASGYMLGTSRIPNALPWHTHQADQSYFCSNCSSAFLDISAAGSTLDHIAKLSIGIVTGCNRVFLLSEKEREMENIPMDDVVSVAARSRHVPGLLVDKQNLLEMANLGERTWLLAPNDISTRKTGVRRRLAKISHRKRRTTAWFQKRNPWWAVDIGLDCDAIFTYMNHLGPRLVLADDGVKCTNTLHRVKFNDNVTHNERVAAAITFISTFGQLAAEQSGRFYGGGVMKFELLEARQLPVLPSNKEINSRMLAKMDRLIRERKNEQARDLADKLLVPSILGTQWETGISDMKSELTQRRRQRYSGSSS